MGTPILFKQNVALAGGDFSESCINEILVGDRFLLAKCSDAAGQFRSDLDRNGVLSPSNPPSGTILNLNDHIANNDGNLVWQKNGGFSASVKNCSLSGVGQSRRGLLLTCDAARRDGSFVRSAINLDDKIANYDSKLTVIDGF
ncbi:hypothetical protein KBT16_18690 [Nostoc sp. CCCryo 231-06]|nr:hypothetical protein [Nostoc sp. CCCryo 231-06]